MQRLVAVAEMGSGPCRMGRLLRPLLAACGVHGHSESGEPSGSGGRCGAGCPPPRIFIADAGVW